MLRNKACWRQLRPQRPLVDAAYPRSKTMMLAARSTLVSKSLAFYSTETAPKNPYTTLHPDLPRALAEARAINKTLAVRTGRQVSPEVEIDALETEAQVREANIFVSNVLMAVYSSLLRSRLTDRTIMSPWLEQFCRDNYADIIQEKKQAGKTKRAMRKEAKRAVARLIREEKLKEASSTKPTKRTRSSKKSETQGNEAISTVSDNDPTTISANDERIHGIGSNGFASAWATAAGPSPARAAGSSTESSHPGPGFWTTLQERLCGKKNPADPKQGSSTTEERYSTPKTSNQVSQKPPAKGTKSSDAERGTALKGDVSMYRIVQRSVKQPQGIVEGGDAIPRLAHNLDRVLFNPGVQVMQDLRSDVYNFDPYLATLPPNSEFDFDALGDFITPSKDARLRELVKAQKHKYCGSTSSLSSILSHFHFLLSGWRKLNYDNISRSWEPESHNFTHVMRRPAAAFAFFDESTGTYGLDADKEFDTETILSSLGKSMEKLLVLPKDQFERYHRERSHEITESERNAREGYRYTNLGKFLVRSQLDAQDSRLPGEGSFDIKTRAVLAVRMNMEQPDVGQPYEITKQFGKWDSFEREYVDMIRAAFLKYSLQVRMGNMDGIFCAFHNTKRIFGFQYIPLEEMDERIHGSSWQPGKIEESVGWREFYHSFAMFEALLEKATARFPGETLRLHVETRDTTEPLMYFFAECVTMSQAQSIQQATKASATLSAERVLRNLEAMQEHQENDGSRKPEPVAWEALKAKILVAHAAGSGALYDATRTLMSNYGISEALTDEDAASVVESLSQSLLDAARLNQSQDDATNSTEGVDVDRNTQSGPVTDTEDISVPTGGNGEESPTSSQPAGIQNTQDAETHSPRPEDASSPPADTDVSSLPAEQRMDNAEEVETGSTADLAELLKEVIRGNVDNPLPLQNFVQTFAEKAQEEESENENTEEADEGISTDQAAGQQETDGSGSKLLGLAVTVKHTVNGQPVERPQFPVQRWDVDFSVRELEPVRASRVLRQIKGRRARASRGPPPSEYQDQFYASIKASAERGAKFRANREQEEADRTGMKVAWADDEVPKEHAASIFTTPA